MQNQLVNFTEFMLNTLFLITYGLCIKYTITTNQNNAITGTYKTL